MANEVRFLLAAAADKRRWFQQVVDQETFRNTAVRNRRRTGR